MTCTECGKPLGPRNVTGLCKTHCTRVMRTPEAAERRRSAVRRYAKANRAKLAATLKENARKARECPEYLERMRDNLRRFQPLSVAPEVIARRDMRSIAAKCSATKLAWCPKAYRAEYRRLIVSKRMLKQEAQRIILDQIAADTHGLDPLAAAIRVAGLAA
jgi:hypothetical protein